ncbi:hypothetical protein Micbo1qcDRAFT_160723 [Microdochium bolleyi]|uniref:Uncharacterized protein n=1 Tax=Microdochium bolleyi TaxID=196109 RepID=A0A136J6W5_9PEZI|nr:hypothetical protein Micbo1qcDRAFT_160723 [Microdochium bolleyi]
MSRLFPHPAYAEDQPYAKTILTTHVLTRGVTTGAVIGGVLFGGRALTARMRSSPKPTAALPINSPTAAPFMRQFLRSIGISTVWTLAVVGVGMVGRMWGREAIEWKDRSWRLLESKGQLEVDDWTYAGMAVGLAASAVALRRGRMPPQVIAAGENGVPAAHLAGNSGGVQFAEALGTVSLGSFAGMLGYMGWRYGLHGGKFPSA